MALNTPLRGATIAMQGIDKTALELMARTGRKISEQALASFRFESATDLAEAGARLARRSRKADNR